MPDSPAPLSRKAFGFLATFYFAVLSLLLFGDTLIDPSWIVSLKGMDMDTFFYPLRWFSSHELREGNVPLWNPYVMGGVPVWSNTLYALLYPPGWLDLILPLNLSINLLISLHFMLAGLFTAAWCRDRGASPAAALIGGTLFMFCGPNTLRIFGGFLVHAFVIAWTPLLFLCIDRIIDGRRAGMACLWGAAVVAMQVLAGYIQPTYFQFFAVCSYIIVRLINNRQWFRSLGLIVAMFSLGGILCAAQLLPAIEAAGESIRGSVTRPSFATSYSLPPENLITSVVPYLFGDWVTSPMFVRWGIVETSIYIGVVGTCLAVVGACCMRGTKDWAALITAIFIFTMALGGYNPIYTTLLRIIPGLELFRCPSRFAFMTCFMAAPLAAMGFDRLCEIRRLRTLSIACIGFSILFFLSGWLVGTYEGLWRGLLNAMTQTGETWEKLDKSNAPALIAHSASFASTQLINAGGSFGLLALLTILSQTRPSARYFLVPLAVLEMFAGSSLTLARFQPTTQMSQSWAAALKESPPGARVLVMTTGQHNLPMQFGLEGIGGYDPAVRGRWDAAVRPLLGSEAMGGNLNVRRALPSNRWPMLRLGTLLPNDQSIPFDPPMPQVSLIGSYTVVPSPDESLLAVRNYNFDPRKTVILESAPTIETLPTPPPTQPIENESPGAVQLLKMTTDSLEILADVNQSAILLITDSYSTGWRVRPLAPTPQKSYRVMPANHCLRAIPLAAGKHHFVLEYHPAAIDIGLLVSGIGITGWCVAAFVLWQRSRRQL